jgi:hypothetical protein
MDGIERAFNKRNAADEAKRARLAARRLAMQDVRTASLDEISDDLGDMRAGRFIALSSGSEPTDADATGAFVSADGEVFDDLTVNIGTVKQGQPAAGFNTDGDFFWAGASGRADADGLHLDGIRYALEHTATDTAGNNPRRGAIEMYYPDGETIPAWRVSFGDGTETTELVTNGDFATGDTTGWTATLSGGSTFAVVNQEGDYRGVLTRASGGNGSVVSDAFAVTPQSNYRIRARLSASAGGAAMMVTVRVDWYTSGATLISSSTALTYQGTILTWEQISTSVKAPLGAATAKVYLTIDTYGALTFDDVSVQLLGTQNELVFDDNGLSVLKMYQPTRTSGVVHNRNTTNSYTTQVMVLRVWRPMRVTAFIWDLRKAGTYALKMFYSTNPAHVMRTLWSGTGAIGLNTIALADPEVLLPGVHYIGMVRSGADTWWDKNATSYVDGEDMSPSETAPAFRMETEYYDGSNIAYLAPVAIVFQPCKWS